MVRTVKHLTLIFFCLLCFTLGATQVHAQTTVIGDPNPELMKTLQKRYETLDGFRADFTQILVNTSSGDTQERTGVIAFKKPDLIRWETVAPEKELLMVGQDFVWDYYPEEGTLYKYDVEELLNSKTMLRFISGKASLEEDFFVTQIADPEAQDLVKLDLVPKMPEPGLVQAFVWVEPKEALFKKITLLDFYGNENTVIFDKLELDPTFKKDEFQFTPPPDAEVFDNTGAPQGAPLPQETPLTQ
ncbi:outer membrane lipoprotein carrier protein LolA [Oceanidesulfovibrio marinus]|uniref:Outer membrane lipoprotein carrier protein LolA n=1 Tax=Oceanidesulfovibrio marinus TaxID=370038 RepID=A0ABX6NCY0_9BACT|nr:outer membrane lipoprotein carrier protein LolA [Oceanidesulfovibrio marinus]